jgi:hypothetical protein
MTDYENVFSRIEIPSAASTSAGYDRNALKSDTISTTHKDPQQQAGSLSILLPATSLVGVR